MHDHYLNKFFQKLFFGNSGNARIFLTVLVFLLNLGLVMGIDYVFIHNLPVPEYEYPNRYPDFSAYIDGEILDANGAGGTFGKYYVLYRDAEGTKLVELSYNTVFHRCNLKENSVIPIPANQNPYIHDEGNAFAYLRFTIEDNTIANLDHRDFYLSTNGSPEMSMYIALAALILLLEIVIFNRLHALFR